MIDFISHYYSQWLRANDHIAFILAFITTLLAIIIVSWLVNYLLKRHILRWLERAAQYSFNCFGHTLSQQRVLARLSHLGPALILYRGSDLLLTNRYKWDVSFVAAMKSLALIYVLLALVFASIALLDVIHNCYQRSSRAAAHPIRVYLQVLKIIIWGVAAILAASVILHKSPWAFLAGLGALSAVLMLIFKDTILGFVSSVQATLYDIIRVGDWITVPSYGVDGDVMEISINTVKVRNFDKTIVTLPTAALMQAGVQNWRGMEQSGGRRIKRAIRIDMETIQFCDREMLQELRALAYMHNYIEQKIEEIEAHNKEQGVNTNQIINGRQLSNIGLFRAYAKIYLQHHPAIHSQGGFTFLIRQLEPTEMGLPIQIYVFTNDTNWVRYEEIQADIFDHLLSALPFFHLRAFQCVSPAVAKATS
ncbi:MAG: mechanosensitive ion channel [Gammaproteobacteria bacterium]|nr:mechanosensitive ion channel [Gammaproteobacteria bacterium]